jgi:putative ABC transport system ATP-binding protein
MPLILQQRVAIARAMVAHPSVLLADEPTAALDGRTGQVIMTLLADVAHAQRCTVLVVTHDLWPLPFADRVLNIEDGRLLPEEPARLFRKGAHARPAARS